MCLRPLAWHINGRKVFVPCITQENPSIKFQTLIVNLDESVELLEAALENVSEAWLEENHNNYRSEKSRYEHITGFYWHESFHHGQLEILKAYIHSKRYDILQ